MSDLKKKCIECRQIKPASDYYRHPMMADGKMGVCKECHKKRMLHRRRNNPEVQAYDRLRSKLPERKFFARANTIKWRKNNPEKYKAETMVGNALRDGKLKKGICEICGTDEHVHAHHDDYSKPLEVRWLCALHHHRYHADERNC